MTGLKIGTVGARGFTLPLDAVTQTFGILAVRGAGKTNTAVVMAEEMGKAVSLEGTEEENRLWTREAPLKG